jgi:hypothetical protein
MALSVPVRSFAILHDAHLVNADRNRPASRAAEPTSPGANHPPVKEEDSEGTGHGGIRFTGAVTLAASEPSGGLAADDSSGAARGGGGGAAAGGGGAMVTMRRGRAGGGFDGRGRSSQRMCSAVTVVPAAHFSAAELEEVLGEDVAPGPRAQAAAMRTGGGGAAAPAPKPLELLLLVDCTGPTGMVSCAGGEFTVDSRWAAGGRQGAPRRLGPLGQPTYTRYGGTT